MDDGIGQALQIEIKRGRIRVEILKADSDISAKFELFQRLNTGGAGLTEQEVRNSVAVSLNRQFYDWMIDRSRDESFVRTTDQTPAAKESQGGVELALRFVAFRTVPYVAGLDVHEYLDNALWKIATNTAFDMATEAEIFTKTFQFLDDALGSMAFKRWNGNEFSGKFLMSVYEVMATGVSHNLAALEAMAQVARNEFIIKTARELWSKDNFLQNSGAGVRGTTRLTRLLPIAADLLRP